MTLVFEPIQQGFDPYIPTDGNSNTYLFDPTEEIVNLPSRRNLTVNGPQATALLFTNHDGANAVVVNAGLAYYNGSSFPQSGARSIWPTIGTPGEGYLLQPGQSVSIGIPIGQWILIRQLEPGIAQMEATCAFNGATATVTASPGNAS